MNRRKFLRALGVTTLAAPTLAATDLTPEAVKATEAAGKAAERRKRSQRGNISAGAYMFTAVDSVAISTNTDGKWTI